MASGLYDATRPRRFDLSMSRRTRRPASLAADCHQEDQAMEGFQTTIQPRHQVQDAELNAAPPSQCLCLSDHLRSQQSEATEETETQQQQQQQQQQEFQDNPRHFSLQELIEDEAADGEKDAAAAAATGGQEEEPDADAVEEEVVAEAAAAGHGVEKRPEHVAGRRVIGMMRRYVRVRSIKTKHAYAPEKNVAPLC